jgi:predicted RNA-binding protein
MNLEDEMCLSTVYMDSGSEEREVMKEVARIEAEGQGFWLINLFGERTFVEGKIQTINLTDGHFITLRKEEVEMALSI